MSAVEPGALAEPAPQAARVGVAEFFFVVFGGPAAWLAQLCAAYVLASTPCFKGGLRLALPPPTQQWTGPAMAAVMLAAIAVALIAMLASWRVFSRTRDERDGGGVVLMHAGAGRTRFLAFWGVVYGAGFAAATLVTALAFMSMPRCAG